MKLYLGHLGELRVFHNRLLGRFGWRRLAVITLLAKHKQVVMQSLEEEYLVVAASVDGPALLRPDIDMRFSALLTMVFILVNILLPTLFSLSLGTDGPPWAGELIVA